MLLYNKFCDDQLAHFCFSSNVKRGYQLCSSNLNNNSALLIIMQIILANIMHEYDGNTTALRNFVEQRLQITI